MIITAFFTDDGTPATGLSPLINIFDLADDSLVVTNGAMSEISLGGYKYDFTAYDTSKNYFLVADGTATLPNSERYVYGGNESFSEEITAKVWDENLRDHQTAHTTGYKLKHITGGGVKKIIQKSVWSEEEKMKMIDKMKEFEEMLMKIRDEANVTIDEESVNNMTSQLSAKLDTLNTDKEVILSLSEDLKKVEESVKQLVSNKDKTIDSLNEKIDDIHGINKILIGLHNDTTEDMETLAKLVTKTFTDDELKRYINEIKNETGKDSK